MYLACEEDFMKNMKILEKYQKFFLPLLVLFLVSFLSTYKYSEYLKKALVKKSSVPSIWVSMSLCWSGNAQIHKKSKFPYRLAAQLSTSLWRKVTEGEVKVILTIVHDEDADVEDLAGYVDTFAIDEGVVVVLEKTSSLGCILQSQLSRMFAFKHDAVEDEDIIITSDVDIFVMDKKIIEPLKMPFTTWIYRCAFNTLGKHGCLYFLRPLLCV